MRKTRKKWNLNNPATWNRIDPGALSDQELFELAAELQERVTDDIATGKFDQPKPAVVAANNRDALEAVAIAMLAQIGPNAKQIAERLHIPRTTLMSWRSFRERYNLARANRATAKSQMPRGSKSKQGDLEAWHD